MIDKPKNSQMAEGVDAYLEYRRIVGSDDGGKLMTPKEYEEYLKTAVPKRMNNRLFVNWTNSTGLECKAIGPETMCFCMHRYKEHLTDFDKVPEVRPLHIKCKVKSCKCKQYLYIPFSGGGAIKCTCKHSADLHDPAGKRACKKDGCNCKEFKSSYTCDCTEAYSKHSMLIETKEERHERGKSIGQDVPYAAMGGITGFSSLLDGYMRLDGTGKSKGLNEKELDRSIDKDDHPFLKMHAPAIQKHEAKKPIPQKKPQKKSHA